MSALLAHLLRHPHEPDDEPWDDHGVEDISTLLTELARATDAGVGRAAASRGAVLGAFASAMASSPPAGALPSTRAPASAAERDRRRVRRAGLALASAGVLAIGAVTAVLASDPGRPLYPARVAAEGLFLPSDPTARAEAQLGRMDERTAEAQRAASAGDAGAAHAALLAYARIADEAAIGPLPPAIVRADIIRRIRLELAIIAGIDMGDTALADARGRVQAAAGRLLAAMEPSDAGSPMPGSAAGSSTPSAGPGTSASGSAAPASTPGRASPEASGGDLGCGTPAAGGQTGGSTHPASTAPAAPNDWSGPAEPSRSNGPAPGPVASPGATAGAGSGQGRGTGNAPTPGQGYLGDSPSPGPGGSGNASAPGGSGSGGGTGSAQGGQAYSGG